MRTRTARSRLSHVALVCAAAASAAVAPAFAQSDNERVSKAETLIQQGWQSASKPSEARRPLQDAEKLLRDELKANPRCEKCFELLAANYFYRAALKIGKSYDEAVKVADQGLQAFPSNGVLSLFKGYALFRDDQFAAAAKALNRYLTSPRAGGADADDARKYLADSRARFLSSWYNQRDFYVSYESRLERINPQTAQKEIAFQITRDYELGLGQQAFTALQGSGPAIQSPEITQYLQQLVTRLTKATPGPDFPYTVSLIDSPEINAVTPPGHIVIYSGMLRFVETESELAGVLAHELAHNYGHHAGRRVLKAVQGQQIVAGVAAAINPQGVWSQIATQVGANLALGLFLNAYSRFEESEADRYGAHILHNAGYNPTAMTASFLKMYRLQPKQPIKFLSTHPPLPDRVDALTDYLEAFPLDQELALDSETFRNVVKTKYPTALAMAAGATPLPRPPSAPAAPPSPAAAPAVRPAPSAPPTSAVTTPPPIPEPVRPPSTALPPASALPPVATVPPVAPAPGPVAPGSPSIASPAAQPIGWNQNLWTLGVAVIGATRAEFSTNVLPYSCPPGQPQAIGTATSAVIGSGPYFSDSSICAAGVHAGVIGASSGGVVTIRPRAGTMQYAASARNSISSAAHTYNNPPFDVAFDIVVLDNTAPVRAASPTTGIAGQWQWFTGSIVTFTDYGTFSGGGLIGRWEVVDQARRSYRLTWSSGSIDEVSLSPDGRRLEGRNQFGAVWGNRTR